MAESEAAEHYKKFLKVFVNGTPARALVDSGNDYGSVISKEFFFSMGYTAADIEGKEARTVGTAKKGANLQVLGVPKPELTLTVQGQPHKKYPFYPAIMDGLAMHLNISGPWMRTHKWDQLHSKDSLRIGEKEFKLEKRALEWEECRSFAYLSQDVEVPANGIATVQLRVAEVEKNRLAAGYGVLTGDTHFMESTTLNATLGAIVQVDPRGRCTAAIINAGDEPRIAQKGQRYGVVQLLEPGEEGVCTLQSRTDQPSVNQVNEYAEQKSRDITEEVRRREGGHKGKPKLPDPEDSWSDDQRREWLRAKFDLANSPFLGDPKKLKRALDVLMEFWDTFSHDGSYGSTDLIQHRIITDPNVYPIKERYRPPHPSLEESLRKQLDQWLEQGVIEAANSPWSFNLVPVKKKNGKIRWCVDWRKLNKVTKK